MIQFVVLLSYLVLGEAGVKQEKENTDCYLRYLLVVRNLSPLRLVMNDCFCFCLH